MFSWCTYPLLGILVEYHGRCFNLLGPGEGEGDAVRWGRYGFQRRFAMRRQGEGVDRVATTPEEDVITLIGPFTSGIDPSENHGPSRAFVRHDSAGEH